MMPECNFIPTFPHRVRIEHAPAQPRAERAWIGAFRKILIHHLHYVTRYDPVSYSVAVKAFRKVSAIEHCIPRMDCHRGHLEIDRGLGLQMLKRIEQRPGVFTA